MAKADQSFFLKAVKRINPALALTVITIVITWIISIETRFTAQASDYRTIEQRLIKIENGISRIEGILLKE